MLTGNRYYYYFFLLGGTVLTIVIPKQTHFLKLPYII